MHNFLVPGLGWSILIRIQTGTPNESILVRTNAALFLPTERNIVIQQIILVDPYGSSFESARNSHTLIRIIAMQSGTKAIRRIVRQENGFFFGFEFSYRQYGSKYLETKYISSLKFTIYTPHTHLFFYLCMIQICICMNCLWYSKTESTYDLHIRFDVGEDYHRAHEHTSWSTHPELTGRINEKPFSRSLLSTKNYLGTFLLSRLDVSMYPIILRF